MSVTIVGPNSVTLPAVLGSDRLDAVRVKQAVRVRRRNGTTEVVGIDRNSFALSEIVRMVNAGCEIYGLEVWFELDRVAVLSVAHPLAPTEDEESNPITPQTWEEYGVVGRSHYPMGPYDGKYYRSSAMFISGEPLKASLWTDWVATPPNGVTVITVAQFQAIQAAHANP